MAKKVAITGSLGYIGSVLGSYLTEFGYSCIGYDTGFFKNCLLYSPKDIQTVSRDARDIVEKDLDGVDVLVHLAGIANDPMRKLDEAKVYDPTLEYALGLAKICKKNGIKFIFASSCSVYGRSEDGLVNEDSVVFPQTGYSLNKVKIENGLRNLSDKNFSPISLRFSTVFGLSPRMRFDTVTNMFAGMAITDGKLILNSDGTPWRPIVHIQDACEAIKRSIEFDHNNGELLVLNVGDEANNLQVINIAEVVAGAIPGCTVESLVANPQLDKEGLIRDRKIKGGVDTRTYKVSFQKIREVFPGFKCTWSAERGVKEMTEFFKILPLTKEIFKQICYYRLQQLEYLHENNHISDELRWITD